MEMNFWKRTLEERISIVPCLILGYYRYFWDNRLTLGSSNNKVSVFKFKL